MKIIKFLRWAFALPFFIVGIILVVLGEVISGIDVSYCDCNKYDDYGDPISDDE